MAGLEGQLQKTDWRPDVGLLSVFPSGEQVPQVSAFLLEVLRRYCAKPPDDCAILLVLNAICKNGERSAIRTAFSRASEHVSEAHRSVLADMARKNGIDLSKAPPPQNTETG